MITSTIELRSTSIINPARRRLHHVSTDDIAEDVGSDNRKYRPQSLEISAAITRVIGRNRRGYRQRSPKIPPAKNGNHRRESIKVFSMHRGTVCLRDGLRRINCIFLFEFFQAPRYFGVVVDLHAKIHISSCSSSMKNITLK